MDLSFLDRPEILEVIFPIVYSPFELPGYLQSLSPDVPSYSIEVEDGVKIGCGFWVSSKEAPSILYFHGNGETVATHDWIAPLYNQRGINLFVADYRGYGASDGKPTISNMIADSHAIFKGFKEVIKKEGLASSLFFMGRSLGSPEQGQNQTSTPANAYHSRAIRPDYIGDRRRRALPEFGG